MSEPFTIARRTMLPFRGPSVRGAGAAAPRRGAHVPPGGVDRTGSAQIALNSSNGWRQALHQAIALHAVEPKALRSSVSVESQKGQAADSRRGRS